MRKLILVALLSCLPLAAEAQSVNCTVSGLNAKQTALLADFLVAVNAQRAAAGQPPFANFDAYCSNLVIGAVLDYVKQQGAVNAAKVGAAAEANGDQSATNAQCTATGQANGCSKSSVACFVLAGNVTCAP